mgnify:CR=1 FL=1|jgi:hypothetical protein
MGVLSGKDLFSPKWPTAIIIDAVNTAHFIQVKHPVGDYFFAEINSELYAFDTKGDNFKWRQSMAKTFEFQIFFTDHYKPLTGHIKELELMTEKNNLPKMSIALYKTLSLLKLREKRKFENFKILKLIEELEKEKEKNPQRYAQYKDVISYLQDLGIDEITTPVRRVSDYLDESFMATDPKYLGSVKTAVQLAFTENREINHKPITSKKGWIKIAAVMLLIMVIGLVGYMAYDNGAFDGLTDQLGAFDSVGNAFKMQGGTPQTASSTVAQYATPEAARAAIDSGQADINDFPEAMRPIINSVEVKASP